MPRAIHLLCQRSGGSFTGLTRIEGQTYRTGWWKLPRTDALSLIGGWVYLHETKAKASLFGGRVLRIEPAPPDDQPGRWGLVFEARREGARQLWRDPEHGMAWADGSVEADSWHERAADGRL